jgi:hypothetical protein
LQYQLLLYQVSYTPFTNVIFSTTA